MKWKAIVDRFEEKQAVLLVGDEEQQLVVPISLLPKKLREGDHLLVTWEIDHASTAEAEKRVTAILDRLVNRSKEN